MTMSDSASAEPVEGQGGAMSPGAPEPDWAATPASVENVRSFREAMETRLDSITSPGAFPGTSIADGSITVAKLAPEVREWIEGIIDAGFGEVLNGEY